MDGGQSREEKVLNRIIRVDREGWHYEPDQRHAEISVQMLGLEKEKAKSVGTPGIRLKKEEIKEGEESQELDKDQSIMQSSTILLVHFIWDLPFLWVTFLIWV